ncbi:MAG: ATPase V [Bacteroidales bacterium]|nr:ATPase V [Bacteroidales bacterium]
MIVPMTKYSFILLGADKEHFFDKLSELGVVDITRSHKAIDNTSLGILSDIENTKEKIKCLKALTDDHLKSLQAQKSELQKQHKDLVAWGEYDISLLSGFDPHFFSCHPKLFDNSWAEKYALEIIHEDKDKVYFIILGNIEGFPLKALATPVKTAQEVQAEIDDIQVDIDNYIAELQAQSADIPKLEESIEQKQTQLNIYLATVAGESAAEDSLIVYQGFAPTEIDNSLQKELDTLPIYYSAEAAVTEDTPPIKLRNNKFVSQFEVLTKMYGMPVYNEFDPTIFLSIFFLLFFAMCMGDAGYGIMLVAIGFFLKSKGSGGLANMWSLIVTLGVGTFVVGLLMGGFFGLNLVDQSWVPQWLKSFMITGDIELAGGTYSKQMALSLVIGIAHISLALIMKAVWSIKKDGFKNSLSALGWTLLIVGGIITLVIGLTGIVSQQLMTYILIAVAVLSALGIYIFNRWGRNPLVNIGSGLWDTYNMVSGLLGDVLSYIRLYALGLSGAMLGQTFNQIAEMVKGTDPTWQWLPFILILLFGHVLNIAMSCLGAFVHPLRLNFVEFFKNSGYEGTGSSYSPIKK